MSRVDHEDGSYTLNGREHVPAEVKAVWDAEKRAAIEIARPASKQKSAPAEDEISTSTRYEGRRIDVAALLAEPDTPISWRCDLFAADGYLTLFTGRGGEGKSWTALALALGVGTGTSQAGMRCRRGKALIFDAENGRNLLRRRFRAAGVTGNVSVALVDGLDIVKDASWFEQVIREERANLVVFDSLRMLSSGRDENDSGAMEPPLSTLRRMARSTGAAIVLIHHRGKGQAGASRGSSVIEDQADMAFTIERQSSDPEQRTRRKVFTAKCRIAEEPGPRWLSIVAQDGKVSVEEAEPYDSDGGTGRPRDTIREEILGALTGISQSQARIARAVGRDPKDQTVRRVLRDLAEDGLATKNEQGWGVSGVNPLGSDTLTPPRSEHSALFTESQGSASDGWGMSGVIPLGADTLTPPDDGLGDLSPERPSADLADALEARECRCDRPLPSTADGEIRCARCGHSSTWKAGA